MENVQYNDEGVSFLDRVASEGLSIYLVMFDLEFEGSHGENQGGTWVNRILG